jgi:hypothetical protein
LVAGREIRHEWGILLDSGATNSAGVAYHNFNVNLDLSFKSLPRAALRAINCSGFPIVD